MIIYSFIRVRQEYPAKKMYNQQREKFIAEIELKLLNTAQPLLRSYINDFETLKRFDRIRNYPKRYIEYKNTVYSNEKKITTLEKKILSLNDITIDYNTETDKSFLIQRLFLLERFLGNSKSNLSQMAGYAKTYEWYQESETAAIFEAQIQIIKTELAILSHIPSENCSRYNYQNLPSPNNSIERKLGGRK